MEAYKPLFILPALPLFPIPHHLRAEVKDALEAGFSMASPDANAAANQLRRAVECLMDQLKVQKWPKNKGQAAAKQPATAQPAKKRKPLSLHARIEKLPVRYAAIKKHLLAIKWLGNDGSHESGIDRKNMLIGYEILEHCLEKLYSDKEDQIQKKSRPLTRRRGSSALQAIPFCADSNAKPDGQSPNPYAHPPCPSTPASPRRTRRCNPR